jgi:glutamyl-tRNA synthetase
MDIKERIRFFALENAVKFKGKANPGAVIGKIISEFPEKKEDMKSLSGEINQVIREVNSMPLEEQIKEYESKAPAKPKEEKKQPKKELPELPNAEMGKVVTRIPPEPSKYNHIGHALSFLINYNYAKKYNGKCIIRFEDTNPEKASQEYVDAMIEDVVDYLNVKADRIMFVSDDLPLFYEYAQKLIMMEKAYVCVCDRETMQKQREEGESCRCTTKNTIEHNLKEWEKMLDGKYDEGGAILRLVGDMKSENHVMRDPVIFRINKTKHYRQANKYCVWPMYDFENSVEDSVTGVTHILRSSEFGNMRVELQDYIKDLLRLPKQTIIQYGRFNIAGATTKGREIREMIEKGEVSGWDDPSLVTLKALKRRGIVKETYTELMYQVGLSASTDKNIDWTLISSINRSILDASVNRFFFVNEPVKISIKGAPKLNPELKLHPEHTERGMRKFETSDEFFVAKEDFEKFKPGMLVRLMDCLNFEVTKDGFKFHSLEHEQYKEKGSLIIHWLPASEELVNAEVRMPDNMIKKGLAEQTISNLEVDDVVQFARFGFCRLDQKEKNKYLFWFTNK